MTLERFGGAFAAGDTATGLRFLRTGFGRTAEDDRLFALGYPHVVLLTTPPARPKDLKKQVETAWVTYEGKYVLFQLEANTSSEEVATLSVAYVGKVAAKKWKHGPFECYADDCFGRLHFILLRCPKKVAAALRKQLEVTFKKIAPTMKDGLWRPMRGLDLCLHGVRGVKRSGYRPDDTDLSTSDLTFAHDDPAFVASEVKREIATQHASDCPDFDARLAFLGGPATARLLRRSLGKFNREERKNAAEQLARVAAKPR